LQRAEKLKIKFIKANLFSLEGKVNSESDLNPAPKTPKNDIAYLARNTAEEWTRI
jgi:hypothetical protein